MSAAHGSNPSQNNPDRDLTRRQLLAAGGFAAGFALLPMPANAVGSGLNHPDPGAPAGRPVSPNSSAIPAWFDGNRVQAHTRLMLGVTPPWDWYGKPEFEHAGAAFKDLGAGAFARHFKWGNEDPPWPTALPLGADGRPFSDRDREVLGVLVERGRNLAQEFVDEAHGEGMKVTAYYWHMAETRLETLHPEWVCRQPDRTTPVEGVRGNYLDMTGPYGEVVLTRLLELASYGVDGLFFDDFHLPPTGCWGTAVEDAWVAETGQPAPAAIDDNDPVYREFISFTARRIEDTFAYWQDQVKSEYPDVVFIVSGTTVPALTDRRATTRLARIVDSSKSEESVPISDGQNQGVFRDNPDLAVPADHVRRAVGLTTLRDAADGRPPHVWINRVPNTDHALAFAALLLTVGCVANIDVRERYILGEDPPDDTPINLRGTPVDALKAAFALGSTVSPHLAGTKPLRWAAVHFSERIRNARGADYRAAWQEVLWPFVGAFQVLSEDGLPVGVVNDYQLEHGELDRYDLLILPNPDELTATQRHQVTRFKARGASPRHTRVVLGMDPAWAWSDPAGTDAAAAAFRATVQPHVTATPVQVSGRPSSSYGVSYTKSGQLAVAVTNNLDWMQRGLPDNPNPPAPPAEGVQVTWQPPVGSAQQARPATQVQAVEAVTGTTLPVESINGAYRVNLPPIPYMALLVVTEEP